jgi:hypothetical protein
MPETNSNGPGIEASASPEPIKDPRIERTKALSEAFMSVHHQLMDCRESNKNRIEGVMGFSIIADNNQDRIEGERLLAVFVDNSYDEEKVTDNIKAFLKPLGFRDSDYSIESQDPLPPLPKHLTTAATEPPVAVVETDVQLTEERPALSVIRIDEEAEEILASDREPELNVA